jgi:hypothetical protein
MRLPRTLLSRLSSCARSGCESTDITRALSPSLMLSAASSAFSALGCRWMLVDAAVGGAGLAANPAGGGHAVAKAGHGHGGEVQALREFGLRERLVVAVHGQSAEQPALRAGEADAFAREAVELFDVELADLLDEEAEALGEVPFHKGLDYLHVY